MTNLRITIPSAVYNAIFRTTHRDRSRQAEAAASAAVRAVAEDLRSSADGVDVTDDYDAGWKRAGQGNRGNPMTTNHPIDPTLPRAGWLATVGLNTGTKKTRHFTDFLAAREWVELQVRLHKVLWDTIESVTGQ